MYGRREEEEEEREEMLWTHLVGGEMTSRMEKTARRSRPWKSRHSMTWRPRLILYYVTVVILSHHREFLEFRARVRDGGRVDMIQQSLAIYKLLHSTI